MLHSFIQLSLKKMVGEAYTHIWEVDMPPALSCPIAVREGQRASAWPLSARVSPEKMKLWRMGCS